MDSMTSKPGTRPWPDTLDAVVAAQALTEWSSRTSAPACWTDDRDWPARADAYTPLAERHAVASSGTRPPGSVGSIPNVPTLVGGEAVRIQTIYRRHH
jgi:hypothetical protein